MRIDRLLANSGYGTRSQIKDMVRGGRVRFKGEIVSDSGLSIKDDQISFVSLDNMPVASSRYLYIALHKPSGYLTALEDSRLPTIADLIPQELLYKGLAPVGRLDFNTTGLLLLTNNGTLAHRLTSPKWHVEKTYLVTYSGAPLTEEICCLFAEGMTLNEPDHKSEKLAPAKLVLNSSSTCHLTLTEGKTHQVKRMIAAVDRSVTALHRESTAGITLAQGPESGHYRNLTDSEIDILFAATELSGSPR
ncbi:MAG: pseudouridine synthase [Eubacteriales bacterium]